MLGKMLRAYLLITVLSGMTFSAIPAEEKHGGRSPPNIVLVMADDLGWNDVQWNNPDMITPNLYKMARKGVILDNLYVQPLCSPSRAAFLTGYYPYHFGFQDLVVSTAFPKYIPENVTILSEILTDLDYRTHIIGKWHVGCCNIKYTPTRRGFDTFMGTYQGGIDHYTRVLGSEFNPDADGAYDFRDGISVYRPPIEYDTDTYTRRAIDIISAHDHQKPMFLYLAYTAPHFPLQVPNRYSKLYRCVDDTDRRTYSGMVTALDESFGEVVTALKKHNFMDNTIIFFLSDNGGSPTYGANNLPFRGVKGSYWEGGVKSASFVYSENLLLKTGYRNERMMHVADLFPTIVSLAGGTTDRRIDGRNQWPAISENAESARDEFVYNINERAKFAAIRVGDFKLMAGDPGTSDRFQIPPNSCDNHRSRMLLSRIYSNRIHHLTQSLPRQQRAGHSFSCIKKENNTVYRLYNIKKDPEERHNLACRLPNQLKFMQKRLSEYSKTLVQAQEDTNDPSIRSAFINGVLSHRCRIYESVHLMNSTVHAILLNTVKRSRAAFLTGYYPFHFGFQDLVVTTAFPKYIPENVTILSEILTDLDYSTHIIGKRIDGRNQWPAISENAVSARDEFVYNINERTKFAAIRVGDFKLMAGDPGPSERFQIPPNSCENHPSRMLLNRIYSNRIHHLTQSLPRQQRVDHNFSCIKKENNTVYRLYNIKKDPEERHNLACRLPKQLKFMQKRLSEYSKTLVQAQEDTNDPSIRPAVINGVLSHRYC